MYTAILHIYGWPTLATLFKSGFVLGTGFGALSTSGHTRLLGMLFHIDVRTVESEQQNHSSSM